MNPSVLWPCPVWWKHFLAHPTFKWFFSRMCVQMFFKMRRSWKYHWTRPDTARVPRLTNHRTNDVNLHSIYATNPCDKSMWQVHAIQQNELYLGRDSSTPPINIFCCGCNCLSVRTFDETMLTNISAVGLWSPSFCNVAATYCIYLESL